MNTGLRHLAKKVELLDLGKLENVSKKVKVLLFGVVFGGQLLVRVAIYVLITVLFIVQFLCFCCADVVDGAGVAGREARGHQGAKGVALRGQGTLPFLFSYFFFLVS